MHRPSYYCRCVFSVDTDLRTKSATNKSTSGTSLFLASKDVQCPAGVQLATVFEDQGHLWELLLQPGLLGAITFATERVLEDLVAGAAEVLKKNPIIDPVPLHADPTRHSDPLRSRSPQRCPVVRQSL